MVSRTYTGIEFLDQLINKVINKFSNFIKSLTEYGRINELKKEFQKKIFIMDENGNDCFTLENNQFKLKNIPLIFELTKNMTVEVYRDPTNRNRYKEMRKELMEQLKNNQGFLRNFIKRRFQDTCCVSLSDEKLIKITEKFIKSSNMDVVPFISFIPVKKRNKLGDIIDSSYTEIHHWLEYVKDLEESKQKTFVESFNEFFDEVIKKFVLTESDRERVGDSKFNIFDPEQEVIKMFNCCKVYISSELPFLRFNMRTEELDEILNDLSKCENVEIIEKELTIKPAKIEFEIKKEKEKKDGKEKEKEKVIRKVSEGKEFSPTVTTDILSEDQKIIMYGIKISVNERTETYYLIRFKGKKIDKVCITGPLEASKEALIQSLQ